MRTPKDWGQPCPNHECTHYSRRQRGNVSAIATYLTQSGKRRIFRCQACGTSFSETRDTAFFDLRTPEERVILALKMLLVRVDLSGISFVLGVTEETVLEWLRRAALQAEQINAPLLRDLPVTQIQLDEMWNFIERKHTRDSSATGESGDANTDGRQWIWVSFAPEFRLMLVAVVGPRTLATATEVIAATKARVRGVPAFFSDGFPCYLAALIACFHTITTFSRTGKRGRPRKPVTTPHPALVYGQLIKEQKQGRLETVTSRGVLGAERLAPLGLTIRTALIERLNLTMRQSLAPLVRKTSSFCKDRERMRQRVVVFQTFYNFARPHMSLRTPLPLHECVPHGAIRPRWHPQTPAMAAGVTDHVWTFREC